MILSLFKLIIILILAIVFQTPSLHSQYIIFIKQNCMTIKYNNQIPSHILKLKTLAHDQYFGRLNFPLQPKQKKHFLDHIIKDQIQLALQEQRDRLKIIKRNYLDTSDIEGSQPKKWQWKRSETALGTIQKQRKQTCNDKIDNGKSKRQKSEIKMSNVAQLPKIDQQFQYNRLQKGGKKLRTEPSREDYLREGIFQRYEGKHKGNSEAKKVSLLHNPTFLSSIFFA